MKIHGKINDHTTVDLRWFPVGANEIDALDTDRGLDRRPASWIEARLWVALKVSRGATPSVRQIATWAMWSKRQATDLRRDVLLQAAEWTARFERDTSDPGDRKLRSQNGTVQLNDHEDLERRAGHKRDTSGTLPGQKRASRAILSSTITDTDTDLTTAGEDEPPPKIAPTPKAKKKKTEKARETKKSKVEAVWSLLTERRLEYRPRARLPVMSPDSKGGLEYALFDAKFSPEDIVQGYAYFVEGDDSWGKKLNCDLDTFVRKKHIVGFVNRGVEWRPEESAAASLLVADEYDENGVFIQRDHSGDRVWTELDGTVVPYSERRTGFGELYLTDAELALRA
jgi:hypothetical protein